MPALNIVAAVALNGVIGNSKTNALPWKLPTDLKHFREVTLCKTVVMGRNTFESIGCHQLPDRRNIVVTSDPTYQYKHEVITCKSLREALVNERHDLYVIGGQWLFEEAFDLAPRNLYLTIILAYVEGDVRFPVEGASFLRECYVPDDLSLYRRISKSPEIEENGFRYFFTHFQRTA